MHKMRQNRPWKYVGVFKRNIQYRGHVLLLILCGCVMLVKDNLLDTKPYSGYSRPRYMCVHTDGCHMRRVAIHVVPFAS